MISIFVHQCLNIFWIWSWTSYILIQQLATIAHLLNIFINTTQTYSTLASFQHLLLLNNIPIRNPPHLENRSNHHCPVESRKPATRSSLIIRGKIVEREKRVEPRAVPGGTKDPRYRCQRRGSSYTKWVKVGNPFWGWSTTSRLSLSLYPDTMFLVSVLPACTHQHHGILRRVVEYWAGWMLLRNARTATPTSTTSRFLLVRVWPGPGRDWLTEYRWWLFAGMDIVVE